MTPRAGSARTAGAAATAPAGRTARAARTGLGALLLTAGTLAAIPVAPAAAAGCTADSGVRVVVDAGALGGVRTGCAAGDPANGRSALQGAGFSVTDVPRQPGFICSIDARPDPCNGAPADAYWSYWYAPAGGSWTYSSRGSSNRDPAPGTVEGWAFGAGGAPGIAPPRADPPPAPPPPPPPPPPPVAAPAAPPPAASSAPPAPRPTTRSSASAAPGRSSPGGTGAPVT
ncbi:MAG TPA: hypothetical protein VFR07_06685, partial [Mycobacteriales bacterium]|nr:hypothetical protein [Mycobacteriales bacterium]